MVCESPISSVVSAVSVSTLGRGGGTANGEVRSVQAVLGEDESALGNSQMPSSDFSRPFTLVMGRVDSPCRGPSGASCGTSKAGRAVSHSSPCRPATFSGSLISSGRTVLKAGLPVYYVVDVLRGRVVICRASFA